VIISNSDTALVSKYDNPPPQFSSLLDAATVAYKLHQVEGDKRWVWPMFVHVHGETSGLSNIYNAYVYIRQSSGSGLANRLDHLDAALIQRLLEVVISNRSPVAKSDGGLDNAEPKLFPVSRELAACRRRPSSGV
jgi:hypothetical protein